VEGGDVGATLGGKNMNYYKTNQDDESIYLVTVGVVLYSEHK